MKICSLLPSGTEILFALGLGDSVVGVSDLCVYPPEAAAKPVVSRSRIDVDSMSSEEVEERMRQILASGESPYELDVEWLWKNPPDVVLTQDLCYFCEVDAATVGRAVQGMPACPEVVVLQPKTMGGILETIHEIGKACCAEAEAVRLAGDMSKRIDAVTERLARVERRPRTYSLEGINPLVIGGHWIPEMLTLAGGSALYPPGCPARRVEWSEVRDYAPDKLFIDLCSSDISRSLREVPWVGRAGGMARYTRGEGRRSLPDRPPVFQLPRPKGGAGAGDSGGTDSPRPVSGYGAFRGSGQAGTKTGWPVCTRPNCRSLRPISASRHHPLASTGATRLTGGIFRAMAAVTHRASVRCPNDLFDRPDLNQFPGAAPLPLAIASECVYNGAKYTGRVT